MNEWNDLPPCYALNSCLIVPSHPLALSLSPKAFLSSGASLLKALQNGFLVACKQMLYLVLTECKKMKLRSWLNSDEKRKRKRNWPGE